MSGIVELGTCHFIVRNKQDAEAAGEWATMEAIQRLCQGGEVQPRIVIMPAGMYWEVDDEEELPEYVI